MTVGQSESTGDSEPTATAMTRSNRQRRALHGVLLLDKPAGITSNQAVQRVKRLSNADKAGHTGSLDPLATGMLPICFGEATKLTSFMLAADKTYRVTARFGVGTDTGDAEGKVIVEAAVPVLSESAIDAALAQFTGEISQVPPMFSALKHEGQRLYALARRGMDVVRSPRIVRIHELTALGYRSPELELQLRCSKGTYVRTLVEDLAKVLGTVGHVTALRRLEVAPFGGQPMTALETLERSCAETPQAIDRFLLPVDSAIADWPRLRLRAEAAQKLAHGQSVTTEPGWPEGHVRLYSPAEGLIGIGEILPDGRLVPRRIFPGLGPWS